MEEDVDVVEEEKEEEEEHEEGEADVEEQPLTEDEEAIVAYLRDDEPLPPELLQKLLDDWWHHEPFRYPASAYFVLIDNLHYITLHYKLFIVAKVKNCKVHYGASHTTMSGYVCRNKCVFSFRRNDNSDVAVVTSPGRVFQILGPAVANERSPTVTRNLYTVNQKRAMLGSM